MRSDHKHCRDLPAERSGGNQADLSGTRSELQLKVEEGPEVEV